MNADRRSPYASSGSEFPTESEAFFHQYILSQSFGLFERFLGINSGTGKEEAQELVAELLEVVDDWLLDASGTEGWEAASRTGPSRSLEDGRTQYAASVSRLGVLMTRLKQDPHMPAFRGRKIDPEVVWHAVGVNAQMDRETLMGRDADMSMSWEYGASLIFAATFSTAFQIHEKASTDQKSAYARQGATARWVTEASQIAKPAIREEWERWWIRGQVQYENDEDFARKMHAKHGGYKSERSIANLSRGWKREVRPA
ncbi:hypothetical protein [Pseudoxanthomonas sp.]|uniref:hypothetical protein n=1 Tax=Pseudoxanthomonas sp. TaxID=1871049 RepID=UPI0035AF323D